MCVYEHIYVTTIIKKEAMNLKESKGYMEFFKERKVKVEIM